MTHHSPEAEPGPSQRTVEIGVALAMLGFAAIVVAGSLQAGVGWGPEGPRAGFFPFYVGLVIAGASLFNLVTAMAERTPKLFADWSQLGQVLSVIVPTAVYVALVPWLGLYVASFLLIAVFMRWLGHYRWRLALLVAAAVPLAAFVMFEKWFLVPLPKGPIEDWLGL